jgi:hypothetical protein
MVRDLLGEWILDAGIGCLWLVDLGQLMAKKIEPSKFIRRTPTKRPGSHAKPRGMKTGLTGKQRR